MKSRENLSNSLKDFSFCESEPIHTPNRIQSFGFLWAIDPNNWQIVQLSANTTNFLGGQPNDYLYHSISDFLTIEGFKAIQSVFYEQKNLRKTTHLQTTFTVQSQYLSYNTVLHWNGTYLLMDIEPLSSQQLTYDNFYHYIDQVFIELQTCKYLSELCEVILNAIRKITHYDRIMIYKFDEDWNGQVIAENKREDLYSFLTHHFPASDIPPQARSLYSQQIVRIIPHINQTTSELIPFQIVGSESWTDLSRSVLRASSPIHLEYLQNMQVEATLTISIMFQDKLWGMIACHHQTPKWFDYQLRTSLEMISKIFSYHLSIVDEKDDLEHFIKMKAQEHQLFNNLVVKDDIPLALCFSEPSILDIFLAEGAVLYYQQNLFKLGKVPSENQLKKIINWLDNHIEDNIFFTPSMKKYMPEAEQFSHVAAGVLAFKIPRNMGNMLLLWFKPAISQTITWGGNPYKTVNYLGENQKFRVSPRKSFMKWEEAVKDTSAPWSAMELKVAYSFRKNLVEFLAAKAQQLIEVNKKLARLIEQKTTELSSMNQELLIASQEIKANLDELTVSENKLKAILNSTIDANVFMSLNHTILSFNSQFERSCQILFNKAVSIGDSIYDYLIPEIQAAFKDLFEQATQGKVTEIELEINFKGHKNWELYHFFPVYDMYDELIGVAINVQNIDKRKKNQIHLEQQNKVLKEIAHFQSHDVRRPVANILGLIHIMKMNQDPQEHAIYLKHLFNAAEILDKIIHTIVQKANQAISEDEWDGN